MNIFIITSTWKLNKNIRVMLSRKRQTLNRFCMLFYCRQNKITQLQKRVTIFALFSFSFVCLFCFSSVNIFKAKLVVSFCYLSVISDICEPCLGGGGYQYPVSLKQNRQISHIPKIDFRSKAKNIPKNTQNDNAISHIPVIQRTHIPYP